MRRMAKRGFDLFFAILFLVLLSPVYLCTAVIIMIASPGSPIYRSRRVGKGGVDFICYKFRSMRLDSGKVTLITPRNDERIFPFGRFIRKSKIDELPQVFNILKGEMSVVGPRPEDRENAESVFVGGYKRILDVKPGLTSPASLYDYTHGEWYTSQEAYRSEFLPKKLALELYYIDNQSFWRDIGIVLRTAGIVLAMVFGKKEFREPKELRRIHLGDSSGD